MLKSKKEERAMKLLLPTDGSDYSEGAARFLAELAFSADDEITVLHIISWVPFQDDVESHYASLRQIKRDVAPKILDATVNILKPLPAKVATALTEGNPEQSIIEIAGSTDTDLIVMGARGLKGIKQLIIGSVTRSVAIGSSKPVLVIKPPQFPARAKMKILFATDGSDHAAGAAKFLASMPFARDSEITVLNVVWSAIADIPERLSLEIGEPVKEDVARARSFEIGASEKILEPAVKHLKSIFTNVQGITRVGDPSVEILSLAEGSKTDIIVVGCRGLKGVKGKLGSVSRNILTHSKCSILIGKTCP
jgi:nucleotide-binding universal stress UspA family protein